MKTKKTDRRTLMTKEIVKNAMLELLQKNSYDRMTVTALCKEAEITRATFYLHYGNLDDVLNEILNDCLRLSELDSVPLSVYLRAEPSPNSDVDSMLPACQRAASDPKYHVIFTDDTLSHHILSKLYHRQKAAIIPFFMKKYDVSEWEADMLFIFFLHGNFAVNQSLGWKKSDKWYSLQKIIRDIIRPNK